MASSGAPAINPGPRRLLALVALRAHGPRGTFTLSIRPCRAYHHNKAGIRTRPQNLENEIWWRCRGVAPRVSESCNTDRYRLSPRSLSRAGELPRTESRPRKPEWVSHNGHGHSVVPVHLSVAQSAPMDERRVDAATLRSSQSSVLVGT